MSLVLAPRANLCLPAGEPFDFRFSLWKPSHFPSHLERHSRTVSLRTLRLENGQPVGVRMTESTSPHGLNAQLFAQGALSASEMAEAAARLRIGYGLDFELAPFYDALSGDRALADGPIARLYGMRPSCPESMFEILVISILLQNTTVARSAAMLESLLAAFGDEVFFAEHSLAVFADPHRLAASSESFLRTVCRLGYRARYLVPIAKAFASGSLDDGLRGLPEAEAEEALRQLPGIGPYSARVALSHSSLTDIPFDSWNTKIISEFLFGQPGQDLAAVRAEAERRWGRWSGLAALYIIEDRYRENPVSPLATEKTTGPFDSVLRRSKMRPGSVSRYRKYPGSTQSIQRPYSPPLGEGHG